MKAIRSKILIPTLLILAVLLILVFRQRHFSTSEGGLAQQSAPETNPDVSVKSLKEKKPGVRFSGNSDSGTNEAVEKRQETFRQMVDSKNSPVEFSGRVIDQDGNPIPKVQIEVKVRQWYVASLAALDAEGRMIPIEKETDSDGRFEIHGIFGDGFDVESIQKEGYNLSPQAPRSFGISSGSLTDPVIIRMWKEGPKEPLISGKHVFGMDPDNIYTLDLLRGTKIKGEGRGDLRVLISRPANAKLGNKFPWAFKLEGINGGLLETNDEFMYLAPESGYQPKIEMQLNPANANWTPLVKKQFFLRSRDGQVYGRVQVEVNAVYNVHSAIEIEYAVNPAGSRNLQP